MRRIVISDAPLGGISDGIAATSRMNRLSSASPFVRHRPHAKQADDPADASGRARPISSHAPAAMDHAVARAVRAPADAVRHLDAQPGVGVDAVAISRARPWSSCRSRPARCARPRHRSRRRRCCATPARREIAGDRRCRTPLAHRPEYSSTRASVVSKDCTFSETACPAAQFDRARHRPTSRGSARIGFV